MAGAFHLARRTSVAGLERVIRLGSTLFGAALLGLAAARSAPLAVAACFAAGTGMMLMKPAANTLLQTIVEDDKRGRVMSLHAMAFLGMTPLGSLCAGTVASQLGAPLTISIGGAGTLAVAAVFGRALPSLRDAARPVYDSRDRAACLSVAARSARAMPGSPEA